MASRRGNKEKFKNDPKNRLLPTKVPNYTRMQSTQTPPKSPSGIIWFEALDEPYEKGFDEMDSSPSGYYDIKCCTGEGKENNPKVSKD